MLTAWFALRGGGGQFMTLIPIFGGPDDLDDRKHDRHFDQDADDCRQGCPGLQAKQADGRGHTLATYDGEEVEAGEFYIYRTN